MENKYINTFEKLGRQEGESLSQIDEFNSLNGFYVFFSYDLVNSTRYKTRNKAQWLDVIRRFYELIEDGFQKWISEVSLWKYVGDELLLYKKIQAREELATCVSGAYRILKDSIDKLHHEYTDTKEILSIKATIWCANITYIGVQENSRNSKKDYKNIVLKQNPDPQNKILDFLGPDIDLGFRISKFTARRRLVISADLAYLLYLQRIEEDEIEKLKIISYEVLKGIWDGRIYPIIWYEENWNNWEDTFDYDEAFESEFISKIITKNKEGISKLKKIYNDLNKTDEINKIYEYLSKIIPRSEKGILISPNPSFSLPMVHCVAVCFRDDGFILIARRPPKKRRFPNCWEFGCGQLKLTETFEECLKQSYQSDFGIELDFLGELHPIRTFKLQEADMQIPGIIFIARVTNPEKAIAIRHEEINWIKEEEGYRFSENDCVPDFKETIKLAFQAWNAKK